MFYEKECNILINPHCLSDTGNISFGTCKFDKAKMKYICGSCFTPKKDGVGREIIYFIKTVYKENSVKIWKSAYF